MFLENNMFSIDNALSNFIGDGYSCKASMLPSALYNYFFVPTIEYCEELGTFDEELT